jgi:erythronate-4-phosphate dehydrogenase
MKYSRVYINSMAYQLAPEVVTSKDLESRLAPLYQKLRIPAGQLAALTGIEERRWWPTDHRLSDGAIEAAKKSLDETGINVDDIGAGNTGSAVYQCLTGLGVRCKLYDPPLQAAGDTREFCEFSEVLKSDIISLHVPKTMEGPFKTFHLFDESVLQKLTPEQILINACRGEVIDNQALLTLATEQKTPTLVLDVWENEPNIEKALLPFVTLATPHIAGYSLDGRVRGTEMLYQALCEYLKTETLLNSTDFIVKAKISQTNIQSSLTSELLKSLVHLIYDVRRDDALFRSKVNQINGFDQMRKNYPERRELSTLSLNFIDPIHQNSQEINLKKIGFTVKNK